eukprot:TRINITY_DN4670_c0_g3_i4.p1 TRINITY_DN4670_c0_g3~~TRINITY_DN4670_c0_g3_i4.p1  ORF type:complete len:940 (-),score=234.76 TRINITY_DN4670_c0_g3_i4:49-2814(-)
MQSSLPSDSILQDVDVFRSVLESVFDQLESSELAKVVVLTCKLWKETVYSSSRLWRRVKIQKEEWKKVKVRWINNVLVKMSEAPYLCNLMEELHFDCEVSANDPPFHSDSNKNEILRVLFPKLSKINESRDYERWRSLNPDAIPHFLPLPKYEKEMRRRGRKVSLDRPRYSYGRFQSTSREVYNYGGPNNRSLLNFYFEEKESLEFIPKLKQHWDVVIMLNSQRNRISKYSTLLECKSDLRGCMVSCFGAGLTFSQVCELMRRGFRFNWENRISPRRKRPAMFFINRIIHHLLDEMWKNLKEKDAEEITAGHVRHAILASLPNSYHRQYESLYQSLRLQVDNNALYGSYCKDFRYINPTSVHYALHYYSSKFDVKCVAHVCAYLCCFILDWKVGDSVNDRLESKLRELRESGKELFHQLPTTNTFLDVLNSHEPKGSFHFSLKPLPHTKEQSELLNEEDRLRHLFVNERDGTELDDKFIGLLDVYNSSINFDFEDLQVDEAAIPMILKRNRISDGECMGPAIVNQTEFMNNWNGLSGGLLNGLNSPHVFVAGGAVLACMTGRQLEEGYCNSDIDLFIHGTSVAEANQLVIQIIRTIQSNNPEKKEEEPKVENQANQSKGDNEKRIKGGMILVRSKQSVTISCGFPKRNIQIVLRIYKSPAEVLLGFDIDCCAVGFDLTKVWVSPRALRSIKKRYNLVNPTRRSTTYELRLLKYSKRGFGVLVPNLDGSKINPNLYSQSLLSVEGLARLLLYDYDSTPELNVNLVRNARRGLSQTQLPQSLGVKTSSDYASFSLPYGPSWTFKRLNALVYSINLKLYNKAVRSSYIRLASIPTIGEDVFNGNHALEDLPWMIECPMQQGKEISMMTGSFHSQPFDEWEKDVYSKSYSLIKKKKKKKKKKQKTGSEEKKRKIGYAYNQTTKKI